MLWIPGPTEVRPELLAECARPMIGHRSGAMVATIERLDPGLRMAFGLLADSTSHVAVHSASATAMMEASLIGAGQRILCLVNGAFSSRWSKIAETLGKEVVRIEVEWGQVADADEIARVAREQGPFDALTVVSSETSTGTATSLSMVADALKDSPDTMILADLVSWIAGAPVEFDKNRLGFAFAGVQKAFALPPGVAVVCASDAFMQRARQQTNRGFYLDPVTFIEGHAARKTPATPCISLYYALARQLEDISGTSDGATPTEVQQRANWQARFDKHLAMQTRTFEWMESRGLELFPSRENGSPTVSCIRAGSTDVPALISGLTERGLTLGNGYGKLKNETFRIGHMGDHTLDGLNELLSAADEVLG
ncbi:MAG: aspartate aminotransferase-like enzyme [Planctomycetota bacterium]|jgi:aspartate aminotransferase-like enzyme